MLGEVQRGKPYWLYLLIPLIVIPLLVIGVGLFFLVLGFALFLLIPGILYSLWRFRRRFKEYSRSSTIPEGEILDVYFEERPNHPWKRLDK